MPRPGSAVEAGGVSRERPGRYQTQDCGLNDLPALEAVEASPTSTDALLALADVEAARGDRVAALGAVERALEAEPGASLFGGLVLIRSLLEHPEQLERVRDDRSLVPSAIAEIMRFAFGGPAGMPRFAVRDFELRGKAIRKGQMLMLALGGANRDPEVFSDPDVLDIERDTRESLIFGIGPHYCLGANLARQELACMLDAALDIVTPGSRLRTDLQSFTPMGLLKRPVNLPVEIAE